MSKTYWKTRSGEMIDIDKMSVSHLRNALKMVVRAQRTESEWACFDGPHSYIDSTDFYD